MAIGALGLHHGDTADDSDGEEDQGTTHTTTRHLFVHRPYLWEGFWVGDW